MNEKENDERTKGKTDRDRTNEIAEIVLNDTHDD